MPADAMSEPATRLDGDYDYIVVGAGSAGCVVANRLSADPGNRVLLLEAGGQDDWIWFHIPVGYLFAIGNPRSDWMFETEPEPGLNGRALNYPRGKVIGGSSAINAMISMRGQAGDYDHWRQLGLTGWGWDDVLPVFRRARRPLPGRERAPRGRRRVAGRGAAGALGDPGRVRRGGGRRCGIPATADFNTGDNTGVGAFPRQPEARAALVRGARLPEAGADAAQPAAGDRRAGASGCCSTASAPPACATGAAARRSRRAPGAK